MKKGTLAFTVDLPHLYQNFVLEFRNAPAAWGMVEGVKSTIVHLVEIGKIAIAETNIPILLRLYALGIVANPVPILKANENWNDKWNELAETMGINAED